MNNEKSEKKEVNYTRNIINMNKWNKPHTWTNCCREIKKVGRILLQYIW